MGSVRNALHAGTIPKSTATASAIAAVNPSTVGSMPMASSRGRSPGRSCAARANPGQRDAGARAEASEHERVGQHLTDGAPASGSERGAHRQLPLRAQARTSSRFATFAQAIRKKRDRAGQRENRGRTSSTRVSCIGSSRA